MKNNKPTLFMDDAAYFDKWATENRIYQEPEPMPSKTERALERSTWAWVGVGAGVVLTTILGVIFGGM